MQVNISIAVQRHGFNTGIPKIMKADIIARLDLGIVLVRVGFVRQ